MEILKNDLSGKVPRGVLMRSPLVTRLIVLSCILTSSAISFRESGFRKSKPLSKKAVWRLIISDPTFNVVEFLFATARFNQRAEAIAWAAYSEDSSLRLFDCISSAYSEFI